MGKKILIWYLLMVSVHGSLIFVLHGPHGHSQEYGRPAHVVPAGKSLQLDTSLVPEWWTRFDLILRCKLAQNCGDLRVIIAPGTTGEKPIRCNQENALFRLQSNAGPPPAITLFNPTNQDVIITKYSLNNYSAINTGPPRLAVLLTPYAVPAFPVLTALFLALATSSLFLPALILFWNRGVRRITQWPLWISLFFPWVVLILAGTLLIRNKHLLLSWETLLLFPFPGTSI